MTKLEAIEHLKNIAIYSVQDGYTDEARQALDMAIKALEEPERKKGKWIKISPANIYECSECGKNAMTDDISAYDFCHGCGADMRGESND